MRYFQYQATDRPMAEIWTLFRSMGTEGYTNKVTKGYEGYTHTLEIVNAAMSGRLCSTREGGFESFDLDLYERKCSENDTRSKGRIVQKELFIVDDCGNDEEEKIGYGDVSASKLGSVEDSFDEMLDSQDFEQNLRILYRIRDKYIIDKGVDLVQLLKNALKVIPEAIAELKGLITTDPAVGDLILSLCSDSKNDHLIERLSVFA